MVDPYLIVNVISGFGLVAVGILAAFRPNPTARLGLALFLLAWGTQASLSSTAASIADGRTAFVLYWLVQLMLPVEAMLLLRYVADQTREDSSRAGQRVHRISHWASIALAVITPLVALALALMAPGSMLAVAKTNGFTRILDAYSSLFYAPYFVGISLALVLLSWTRRDNRNWWLTSALCIAWASIFVFPLSQELNKKQTSPDYLLVTFAVMACAGLLVAAVRLIVSNQGWRRLSGLAVVAIGIETWIVARIIAHSGHPQLAWAIGGPGAIRLLAIAALLVALWPARAPMPDEVRTKRIPLGVAAACSLLATVFWMLSWAAPNLPASSTYAATFAIVSLVLIAALGGLHVRSWLYNRPT